MLSCMLWAGTGVLVGTGLLSVPLVEKLMTAFLADNTNSCPEPSTMCDSRVSIDRLPLPLLLLVTTTGILSVAGTSLATMSTVAVAAFLVTVLSMSLVLARLGRRISVICTVPVATNATFAAETPLPLLFNTTVTTFLDPVAKFGLGGLYVTDNAGLAAYAGSTKGK